MESPCRVLVAVLGTLAIIHLVQAQGQQGFISLDCGLPANELSPYDEPTTGLRFLSDEKFIQSGKAGRIQPNTEGYLKPYETLRYFPDGIRNCYNLNVEKGMTHLIRAYFIYGNYDGLDIKPKVCLVKTGTTNPLITTLEIRPMGNDTYITKSGSLNLFFRVYLSKSDGYLRYRNDVYDRVWTSFSRNEWTHISTTLEVSNSNKYFPPKEALKTAATPTNSSAPLTMEWSSSNVNNQYYLYAHFAEIQELQTNDSREFNMIWNGQVISGPIIPPKFNIYTIFSLSPSTCEGGKCSFQLRRTNRSTLPPLLNAFEVYTVIQFPQIETNENDVVAVRDIKTTYEISRNSWQGDPCVPRQFMWDGLNCSNTDTSTPRITYLNLSSSGLTGSIAAAIQNLTQLEKLPQGNPRLCLSGSCLPSKRKPFPVAIVASAASVASIIIAVLVLIFVFRKKKPSTVGALQRPPSISPAVNVTYPNSPEPSIQTNKRRFTYSEVTDMTKNFQRVVGEGGFGIVYHGTLNGNAQVAVKVLSQSSTQGYKQFKAEVDLLMRVHHTNLVSLVGYCGEGDHLALIYEFVPNGNLRQHLSGTRGRSNINWGIRLRIAVEAALGLEYLHSGCIPPMIHRDVKTTNILLDEHYKAKLADFGLSRSFPVGGESHVSTVIAGTPGYLDPEYYRTSRLTEKSDVYSFGIVLLEMITNEPVIDQARAKTHITQWVGFELNSGDISSIMDPNLHGDYDSRSAWRALELAMSCAN
ncbi:Protein kinase-like domain superfamily, partial [Arabidopsis suecica]